MEPSLPNPGDRRVDPPPPYAEETSQERRTRQLGFMRELAELNMQAARAAAERIEDAEPGTDAADQATLSLVRSTRAVTTIIGAENRIASGEDLAPARPQDPRRKLLREALHPLTSQEHDPQRRAALRRRLDQAIEDALIGDIADDATAAQIGGVIAKSLGLPLNLAYVSDAFLGMKPRVYEDRPPDDDETDEFARAPPDTEPSR